MLHFFTMFTAGKKARVLKADISKCNILELMDSPQGADFVVFQDALGGATKAKTVLYLCPRCLASNGQTYPP